MKLLAISTAVLAMISCVALASIPSHDQASIVSQASILDHASLGARHETANGNLPITTSDGLGTAKVGSATTWFQKISHSISSLMRRSDILSFEPERRAKGKETNSRSKAVKELPQATAFDERPCWTIKQMSEHRPDECLDANGKMYKSVGAQDLEKAKKDTERWNR